MATLKTLWALKGAMLSSATEVARLCNGGQKVETFLVTDAELESLPDDMRIERLECHLKVLEGILQKVQQPDLRAAAAATATMNVAAGCRDGEEKLRNLENEHAVHLAEGGGNSDHPRIKPSISSNSAKNHDNNTENCCGGAASATDRGGEDCHGAKADSLERKRQIEYGMPAGSAGAGGCEKAAATPQREGAHNAIGKSKSSLAPFHNEDAVLRDAGPCPAHPGPEDPADASDGDGDEPGPHFGPESSLPLRKKPRTGGGCAGCRRSRSATGTSAPSCRWGATARWGA